MWYLAAIVVACLAFSTASNDPTAPVPPPATVEPQNHANPGFTPGKACNSYDSQEGVKGRIRAIPVEPEDKC